MQKLRTGIIGCGKVGHLHAAALAGLPESQFVAVCGRSEVKAVPFANQYGVKAYTDVTEMVTKEKLDAVCICTPHPEHAGPTIAAARAGAHVIVEKPLASSLADCDAMLAAAQAGGVTIGMLCQRRYYPPCQRIRRALDAGSLGRPVLGAATIFGWRDQGYYRSDPWRGTWDGEGGGVLVNQAPHHLDLLLWYMGEVAELTGYWANLNHPYIEVEDTAVAAIRFRSGALGNVLFSNSQNPAIHARVSVHGINGASIGVQTDGGAMFIAGVTKDIEAPFIDLWTIPGEQDRIAQWKQEDAAFFRSIDAVAYFHRLQIEDFLRAIIGGRPPAVSAAEGRRVVELFTAIYRSSRDGRSVKFPLSAD